LTGAFTGFAVPHHSHFHNIAHLAAAQRIGKIVEILDGFVSKLDQNIARLESGFRCRGGGFTSENFTPFSTWPKSG